MSDMYTNQETDIADNCSGIALNGQPLKIVQSFMLVTQ